MCAGVGRPCSWRSGITRAAWRVSIGALLFAAFAGNRAEAARTLTEAAQTLTEAAQALTSVPGVGGSRMAEALEVAAGPEVDGEILGDPVWAAAPVLTGFWQTRPVEGAAASERTEVRVVYTEDDLYVGVVAYDRNPADIVTTDARRDASLNDTDSLQIVFDTYFDRQNGFVFGTNPAGAEYDGQVTDDGSFNLNWDGSWIVRTSISDIGWSAEFAIPLRTLRYPTQDVQTWGVNLQRNIRRRNETAFWAPLTRQYNLNRISLAGQLQGLEIPPPRNLQIIPYVLGTTRQRGRQLTGTTAVGDVGGDIKYGVTPSLALDVTFNTDFAQVEADQQQINLDRFSLFFPEKRPFFLENAGLFTVGVRREAQLFFSRRIGIGPGGRPIPILGGARLTGRIGEGLDVGLLNIQTDSVPGVAPSNNFSVARLRRELPNRSSAGVMFVNRQATGEFADEDDYNRSYALDGRFGIGRNGLVSGFLAKTDTPGISGEDYAYQIGSSLSLPVARFSADYADVGDNFNPEVGFLPRGGFRKLNASVFTFLRVTSLEAFQELRPHVSFRSYWNHEGFQETMQVHLDSHFELRSGHEFHTGVNMTRQGVVTPFEIFPGVVVPPGTYRHVEAQPVIFTNQGAPFSLSLNGLLGGFFGGTRKEWKPSMRLRIGETFDSELSFTHNDIDLPGGQFTTNLWTSRISYSFTSRLYVQALIQHNDRVQAWSSNLRFGWLRDANTGLFVVYNDTQRLGGNTDLFRADRSVTVKFSRMINIFD